MVPEAFDDEDEVGVVVFGAVHDPRVDDHRSVSEVLFESFGERRSDVQFEAITVLSVVGGVLDKRVGGVTGERGTGRLAEHVVDGLSELFDCVFGFSGADDRIHGVLAAFDLDGEGEPLESGDDNDIEVDRVIEGGWIDPSWVLADELLGAVGSDDIDEAVGVVVKLFADGFEGKAFKAHIYSFWFGIVEMAGSWRPG